MEEDLSDNIALLECDNDKADDDIDDNEVSDISLVTIDHQMIDDTVQVIPTNGPEKLSENLPVIASSVHLPTTDNETNISSSSSSSNSSKTSSSSGGKFLRRLAAGIEDKVGNSNINLKLQSSIFNCKKINTSRRKQKC